VNKFLVINYWFQIIVNIDLFEIDNPIEHEQQQKLFSYIGYVLHKPMNYIYCIRLYTNTRFSKISNLHSRSVTSNRDVYILYLFPGRLFKAMRQIFFIRLDYKYEKTKTVDEFFFLFRFRVELISFRVYLPDGIDDDVF